MNVVICKIPTVGKGQRRHGAVVWTELLQDRRIVVQLVR